MNSFKLISDYKNQDKYRKSFNELAKKTFGIDFENWYEKGFWDEKYICYSYVDGDKVISNISANDMTVIVNGEEKKAIQLATVMTDPDYRNRGLAEDLMTYVLDKYDKNYDLIYLSANKNVLNFYPKFGFKLRNETSYTLPIDEKSIKNCKIRSLDISNKNDLDTILKLEENRKPVSKQLGIKNSRHILMFYLVNVFGNDIYYIEDEAVIVIYTIEGDTLHLFDVISTEEFNLKRIVNKIAINGISRVVFHFMPDLKEESLIVVPEHSNYRFVRLSSYDLPEELLFPKISQT